jgi:hypothetical protein
MGHYKKYSGGNHHLRMDMDHERRLIHDAKDDIYKEDRDLRDRKSAAKQTDTKDVDVLTGDALEQADHIPEEDDNSTK